MGELQTILLKIESSGGVWDTTELLVEKKMRIKKLLLFVRTEAAAFCTAQALLGKRIPKGVATSDAIVENKRHGDLLFCEAVAKEVTTAFKEQEHVVLDLGADYVEIEEDDYLYLTLWCSSASAMAKALIYYEE